MMTDTPDIAARVAELREALGHMTPIVVHETPDYAEVMFGEGITHRSQCMTMNPADWLALNTALPIIDAQAAEIAHLQSQVDRLLPLVETFGSQAARQAASIAALEAALVRQADNMAFVLNHVTIPDQWQDKFMKELATDRAALAVIL